MQGLKRYLKSLINLLIIYPALNRWRFTHNDKQIIITMTFFRNCFYLIAVFALLSGCKSTKKSTVSSKPKGPGIQFFESEYLSDALDKAKAENKLVFVDFYTDWCLPCKLMEEDVFSDKEIGAFMNKNFINLKVNAEKGNGPNLKTIYNIYAYPTLLFLDQKGTVLEEKVGAAYHTELRNLADKALATQGQL